MNDKIQFKIESNVPLPQQEEALKDTITKMNEGDSIVVYNQTLRNAFIRFAKEAKKKSVTQIESYRCWVTGPALGAMPEEPLPE